MVFFGCTPAHGMSIKNLQIVLTYNYKYMLPGHEKLVQILVCDCESLISHEFMIYQPLFFILFLINDFVTCSSDKRANIIVKKSLKIPKGCTGSMYNDHYVINFFKTNMTYFR